MSPCYAPLRACLVKTPEGNHISLKRDSYGKALSLPCGKCIGCRLERARQWAVRLMHESECHIDCSFITLTYEKEPFNGSIDVSVAQLFMKRLRAKIAPIKVRFFLCGEYGMICTVCGNGQKVCECLRPVFEIGRPHYHAIIFGYDFPDKVLLSSNAELSLFRSDELDSVWGLGYCSIGSVTFDSCCYVAKYALKKIIGKKAKVHYKGRLPEFLTMSRRPGIGAEWIKKFTSDVFPSDEVIVNGFPGRPPRFYDLFLEAEDPEMYERLKLKREEDADAVEKEVSCRTPGWIDLKDVSRNLRRIEVRRIVAEAKASLKSRKLE